MVKNMKIEEMIENGKIFYDELVQDEHGRFKSWEYCYEIFYNNFGVELNEELLDKLSLYLYMYLSSWGMYRGSSFLLQKDYKIHKPIIVEALKEKYKPLLNIKCRDYLDKTNQDLLIEISDYIEEYFNKVRAEVKSVDVKQDVSYTLITKILLGIYGCVPAYDRYFILGVKKYKVTTGNFNINSIVKLSNFYIENEIEFEELRSRMKIKTIEYPQMKLLDMCFWKAGIK